VSAAVRWANILFAGSLLASLGFMAAYIASAPNLVLGACLGLALAGLGIGVAVWSKGVMPPEEVVDQREAFSSGPSARTEAEEELLAGEAAIGRNRFVAGLAVAAAGTCGVAALFPIRSLGQNPGSTLLHTAWRNGRRAVTAEGVPVKASSMVLGDVLTVFPEGHTDDVNAATLLVRLNPNLLQLPPERSAWVPGGIIGFSKICTHAGCPVGLYRQTANQLLCPCHQSTFDVLHGARVIFGPAVKPLPQLPLLVDAGGYVQASSDFSEPVGPESWGSTS